MFGLLLADSDVEALYVEVALVMIVSMQWRCLPVFAIADDQLALAAADGRHRVRWPYDARLQGLLTGWRSATPGACDSTRAALRW